MLERRVEPRQAVLSVRRVFGEHGDGKEVDAVDIDTFLATF